jgi:enoyl-CoA hydratase
MANEFCRGLDSLAVDALPGAARFAAGEGRHGAGL